MCPVPGGHYQNAPEGHAKADGSIEEQPVRCLGRCQPDPARNPHKLTMKRVLGNYRAIRHNHPFRRVSSSTPRRRPG